MFFPIRVRGTQECGRLSAKSAAQPGNSPARSAALASYSRLAAQIPIMRDILHGTVFGVARGSAEISVPVPRGDTAPDGLALMRELLTSLPAAVAHLSGPDLIIDFANEACLRLISDRDLLGRPLAEALPEMADGMDILHKIMKTGEAVRGSEAMVRFSSQEDAEQLFLDYVCQPVRDADGEITGILLYATDITAHVQGRLELEGTAARVTVRGGRLRGLV